jgi:hypothetical protein
MPLRPSRLVTGRERKSHRTAGREPGEWRPGIAASARRFAQVAVPAGGVREGFRRYLDMMFVFYIAISARIQMHGSLAAVIIFRVWLSISKMTALLELEFHSESHASGVSREPAVICSRIRR